MNENIFLTDYFKECANFISNQTVIQSCKDAKEMILKTRDLWGKLMFAGNGASASLANHASLDSRSYNIIEGIHQIWLMSICDLIIGKQEYSVK